MIVGFIFLIDSLLNITKLLIIIKQAPATVKYDNFSLKIKMPANMANTKLKYFIGVTSETSASRMDFVKKIFPIDPDKPIIIKKIISSALIGTHPK